MPLNCLARDSATKRIGVEHAIGRVLSIDLAALSVVVPRCLEMAGPLSRGSRTCTLSAVATALTVRLSELPESLLKLSLEEVLLLMAVIGLVVVLAWGTTLLGALTTFNDWVGKKYEEQREKNQRADDDNE